MKSLTNIPYMNQIVADPILKWLQIKKSNPLQLSELCRIVLRRMKPTNRGVTLVSHVGSLGLPPLIRNFIMMFDEPIFIAEQRLMISVEVSESSRSEQFPPFPWQASYLFHSPSPSP